MTATSANANASTANINIATPNSLAFRQILDASLLSSSHTVHTAHTLHSTQLHHHHSSAHSTPSPSPQYTHSHTQYQQQHHNRRTSPSPSPPTSSLSPSPSSRSPPPASQQHLNLPDHLYLSPLQPIHEQPPSLIPRPGRPRPPPMDRDRNNTLNAGHTHTANSAAQHAQAQQHHQPRVANHTGGTAASAGPAGASYQNNTHAPSHPHARTPSGNPPPPTSRPKVTRQMSTSSLPATAAASAASAPLKARVNSSSIVSLADVAPPTLRRKTPSTLSMRSDHSNVPNARSQSPLHVPSSSRSAVGVSSSSMSTGHISPDKPVRVAKVSPNLATSARLQRATATASTRTPQTQSPAGTPTPSGPSTRRGSAQRARSPPSSSQPSQLGSAFGSAIASLSSTGASTSASSSASPSIAGSRRTSDDSRMRRPSMTGSMTGPDRPVAHVRNASVVSVGDSRVGVGAKPPLESRHSAPVPAPKPPPVESRRSVPILPTLPPLESRHSGLAEVTSDEVNETTTTMTATTTMAQATTSPPPRHQRQSSLLSPSTLVPEVLPSPPQPPDPAEDYGEPSSNRSSPVRPARPPDQLSPHFRPVFASSQFPPASCPTSPIPRDLPISPEKLGARRSVAKLPWLPGQAPPPSVPTPGSPNLKTVALPALTPTMSPSAEHRDLHPGFRLEENLHHLSLLQSHELAHAHDAATHVGVGLAMSPPKAAAASPMASPGSEDDIEKAKVNRKIADLEISNSSLLSINKTLERTKALQRAEIVKLRRRLREQEPPRLRDLEPGSLGLSAPDSDEEDDELGDITDPQLESRWDRLVDMVTTMRRTGEAALLAKKSGRAVLPWPEESEKESERSEKESVAGFAESVAETEVTECPTEAETETEGEGGGRD